MAFLLYIRALPAVANLNIAEGDFQLVYSIAVGRHMDVKLEIARVFNLTVFSL